jgi:hypothetical protein
MAVELLTYSAYARRRGCDEKAVRKAVAEHRITAIERDGRNWIDPEVADIQWARNTRARVRPDRDAGADQSAAGAVAPTDAAAAPAGPDPGAAAPSTPGYSDHKSRQAAADAERAELETAELARRLVKREQAERGAFDAFRTLRDAVFSACRSQAPMVIGLTEVREVQQLLEDAMRAAFADFESKMQQQLQGRVDA